ncbi:MAG TPA: hypothetical protein VJ249_08600 [Candidatus Bathyarchaeia archaeon]|nr:hypothetical protein [Candidatus Bathyarchaeia archaeon]
MSWRNHVNSALWSILVDAVHTLPMYPHHKAYVRDAILAEQPNMSAEDLALKLNISLGESLVILYELEKPRDESEKTSKQPEQKTL